jgi:ankyrin repeat protein
MIKIVINYGTLISVHFSVLMQTGDINNALIVACQEGCIEMVTVLLDHGADVNYQDKVK